MAYYFNLHHSKCLPYPSKNFVGRDMEMKEVIQLIDFANPDTRIVSIVGSPGFGKSTLAIHVGHHMVDEGVVVHYVNMLEVPHMTVLAEKVLDCAEISVQKVSFQRLLKWGRGLYYDTLLILDNCYNISHHSKEEFQNRVEELVMSSHRIKVLMTSREVVIHLEQFRLYRVHELTTTAACELMGQVTDDLTFIQKEAIANLTGNVPLALRIVASLLNLPDPPSPATVISELRDELIPTLSPQELHKSKQINSSITLSYRYLSLKMQKVGRYLANFPGSFDLEGAYGILRFINQHVTLKYVTIAIEKLVRHSLLEHSQRFKRYQFHRLIQEYFIAIQESIGENGINETRRFAVSFEWHYAQKLTELTHHFSTSHVKALTNLDIERHNIQHLLDLCEFSVNIDHAVHNQAIRCILFAIQRKFLQCRFTDDELYGPIYGITTYCDKNFKLISRRYPDNINAYVAFITELARIEDILHGTSKAIEVFLSRKQFIESMASSAAGQSGSPAYGTFYYSLSDYYNRVGDYSNAKECHEKVLQAAQQLSECDPGLCDYQSIANAYYAIDEHEKARHFYELALEHQNPHVFDRGSILFRLYIINKGNVEILDRLLDLFPSLMAAPASEFCEHHLILNSIIVTYHRHGYVDKADLLREKQLKVLHEVGQKPDIQLLIHAQYLAQTVFERERNYSRVVDLAELAFKFGKWDEWPGDDSDFGKKINKIKVQLWLLIGKAKYLHGNYSEGLDYIQQAVDFMYSKNGTSTFAEELMQACPYIIYRGQVRCLVDLTVGVGLLIGKTVISGMLSNVLEVNVDTLLPEPPNVIDAQMTQLSNSSELATLDIHDVSSWSTISSSERSWFKFIITTIMHVVRITITTPIGIKLTRIVANCIIGSVNVVGVFLKLCLTYLCFRVLMYLARNVIVKITELTSLTINFCVYYIYVLYILVVFQFLQ